MIYLFWSLSDSTICCFTVEADGSNLPHEFAPWSANADGRAFYVGPPDGKEETNTIVLAVKRDGRYMVRTPRAGYPGIDELTKLKLNKERL